MPHVDIFYDQLQKVETDVLKIQQAVDSFQDIVIQIRSNLPSALDQICEEPEVKRSRNSAKNLNAAAREVCDTILTQIRDRFKFTNHLSGARLFVREKYKEFNTMLPLHDIDKFCDAFPMIERTSSKVNSVFSTSAKNFTNCAVALIH